MELSSKAVSELGTWLSGVSSELDETPCLLVKPEPEPPLVCWFSEQFLRDLSKEAVMAAMFGAVITSSYVTTNQIPEYMFYNGKKNI